eukprot:8378578-Lingulodinium_polyedra.AAC.1
MPLAPFFRDGAGPEAADGPGPFCAVIAKEASDNAAKWGQFIAEGGISEARAGDVKAERDRARPQ